jgi:hypothetical protein
MRFDSCVRLAKTDELRSMQVASVFKPRASGSPIRHRAIAERRNVRPPPWLFFAAAWLWWWP